MLIVGSTASKVWTYDPRKILMKKSSSESGIVCGICWVEAHNENLKQQS